MSSTHKPAGAKSKVPVLAIHSIPISSLHPDPKNARLHNKRQLNHLVRSIRAFGFNVPVLVDGQNHVIAGHGRLVAARELGLRSVPTIRLEHLTPDQVRAFRIADNRLTDLSVWDEDLLAEQLRDLAAVELDFDIEATGFSVGEIDLRIEGLNGTDDQPDPADAFPETGEVAITRPGDLWQLGEHRVLCGSALDAGSYRSLLGIRQAVLIFTDPPYNVPIAGFVGGKGKVKHREFAMGVGEMTSAEFKAFLANVFGHLAAFSSDGALHYICMDWRHMAELLAAGEAVYTELKHLCVWAKDRAGMGSFYRSQHELVFVFKSGKGKTRNNIELGRNGRHRSNVWHYPSVLNSRHGEEGDLLALHPTVKPIRLVADAILDASARGEIVLDPFLGSGTTLMACQRVGRVCCGMELDPRYVDVIIRRWQRDSGQEAIHAVSGKTFSALERSLMRKKGGAALPASSIAAVPAPKRTAAKEVRHG